MAASGIPIVDFHAHILPGVDHGSQSPEMSEELLLQAQKAGVAMIVATPHFYAHEMSIEQFLKKREEGFTLLQTYRRGKDIETIPILRGAEVALEKGLLSLPDIKPLTIEGTDWLLLEMPLFGRWQPWMYDALYELQDRFHINILLAHVDRYMDENTARLYDMGFTAQINASSLINGKSRKKMKQLCENGCVHLIGSDVHDDKSRNYTDLMKARKKIRDDLWSYFYTNSLDVLGLSEKKPC